MRTGVMKSPYGQLLLSEQRPRLTIPNGTKLVIESGEAVDGFVCSLAEVPDGIRFRVPGHWVAEASDESEKDAND